MLYSHTSYCLGVLDQICSCALDSVLHFEHLKVNRIAVSYAGNGPVETAVVHVDRVLNQATVEGQDNGDEDVKSSTVDPMLVAVNRHVGKKYTTTYYDRDNFQNTKGVRVWETELWNLRL